MLRRGLSVLRGGGQAVSYKPLLKRLAELRAATRPGTSAHEIATVAEKCAALVAECNGDAEFVEATTVDEAADALDALAKVLR